MSQYVQTNRPMRVDTVLGEDVLLLRAFSGVEAISSPFAFRLSLMSEDAYIPAADLLRTPVTVSLDLADGERRWFNGLVKRFTRLGHEEDLTFYEAEVVPWFWFLDLSKDCRIYQDMTVLEIVEDVFTSHGFSDFEIRCLRSYPTREYAVQYRETHLNFVSRLLEDEAIFYFFEHSESKHVLVLTDDNSSIEPLPHQPVARLHPQPVDDEDVILDLRVEHSVQAGVVTLKDYDFEQPEFNLLTSMSSEGVEEVFDYHPGRYRDRDQGSRYARLMLEAIEAGRQVVHGRGNCRAFAPGWRFELEGHHFSDLNEEYALIHVSHSAQAGDYRAGDGGGYRYQNQFLALPHGMPYCPPRSHEKPVLQGCQTALVVGPDGEEIWADAYGRIKVQFHWDRLGQADEHSSCWIRVGSPWAGKGWGAVTIPRIGNEVIVDFLEGDPDQPIVIGSVYNGDQTPPFDLPGRGIQMGMRSRSSPGGRGYNEISLSDDAGAERVRVNAQHDMATTVGHDQTITVGNDRSVQVGNDQSKQVGNDRSVSVGHDQSTVIGNDRSDNVSNDQTIVVGHNRSTTVGNDESLTVANDRSISVGGQQTLVASGDSGITVTDGDLSIKTESGSIIEKSKAGHNVESEADHTLKAKNVKTKADAEVTVDGQKITLTGLAEVTLAVGGNFVKIDPSGVTIFGTLVKIN